MKRFRLLLAPAVLALAAACSTDPLTLPERPDPAAASNAEAVVGTTASGESEGGTLSGVQSTGPQECYQITVDGLLVTVCDGRTPSYGSGG